MGIVDKAKNAAQKAAGEVKETVGKHAGDRDMEAEGKKEQVSSDLKSSGEKVKDALKD